MPNPFTLNFCNINLAEGVETFFFGLESAFRVGPEETEFRWRGIDLVLSLAFFFWAVA